jgi:NAD-dependent SIR2 family protein deacetylase
MTSTDNNQEIELAAQAVRRARAVIISAGAGMGVDSGLPDFRGPEGFWRAYPPYRELGLCFEEMADPRWFHEDPELAWGFYGHRLNLYRRTVPHPGFAILKRWAEGKPDGGFVYTSNVDGQFQKAGFEAHRIVEIHGSIHRVQCLGRCSRLPFPADGIEVEVDETTFRAKKPLPKCQFCFGPVRPNILMFGDGGWNSGPTHEQNALLQIWLRGAKGPYVIIECGAGTAIPSVRWFSETQMRTRESVLIRINPRETQGPEQFSEREPGLPGFIGIESGALAALEAIDRLL